MTKLVLTRGIPASGKTTWAKAWVAEDEKHRARVNRDDLRFSMYDRYWDVDEKAVTQAQHAQVRALLTNGKDVVVDDTNLTAKFINDLILLGVSAGAEIEVVDFEIEKGVALYRDAQREKKVGEDVINKFFARLHKGKLPPVPPIPAFKKYEPQGLPKALLVDIDGTLAHMTNRGPYDTSRYMDDDVDREIRKVVTLHALEGHRIIVVSGRSAAYRDVLERWLEKHHVYWDEIYMRPASDPTTNDAFIKDALFEEHIRDRFDISFVLDDRNRVVDMWRAKGLKVLQVANGDF